MVNQIVVVNEEVYELSEKMYDYIFKINQPVPKFIKVHNEKRHMEDHQKTCDRVRKHGKHIFQINRILRDD